MQESVLEMNAAVESLSARAGPLADRRSSSPMS